MIGITPSRKFQNINKAHWHLSNKDQTALFKHLALGKHWVFAIRKFLTVSLLVGAWLTGQTCFNDLFHCYTCEPFTEIHVDVCTIGPCLYFLRASACMGSGKEIPKLVGMLLTLRFALLLQPGGEGAPMWLINPWQVNSL